MALNLLYRRDDDDLPDEIYTSLVSSLFGDPKTLIVGSVGTIVACLVTAVKTYDPIFAWCTLALTLVALARAYDVRAFGPCRLNLSPVQARRWELRYVAGSAIYVFVMGCWCFLAFAKTSDPMVQLLSFSMTLVNMIGVAGRNYGSKLLVNAQLVSAGTPMIAGLFWMGDLSYAVVGCVIAPFFVSFRTIANRLRQTLTGAVIAGRDVQLLADRLDAALNNMAHGLCVIDRKGAIAVSNERLPEIIGVDGAVFRPGRLAATAFIECVQSRVLASTDSKKLLRELRARLLGQDRAPLEVPIRGDRVLTLKFRMMPNGSSVVLVEDTTEQKKAAAEISRLAHYDSLTDLPNRAFFLEQIRRRLSGPRTDLSCAVLFIDLDGFKQINDTLGHPSGDKLLRVVAERLRGLLREDALVARLGGDEFIIAQWVDSPEAAGKLARGIVEQLSLAYEVNGHTVVIGASVGIALAPSDGEDADTLLKNADMALYRAKCEGRGKWRFFENDMEVRAKERRALESDLRRALQTGGFELHYQPILSLKSGAIVACEALLRWHHPDRGPISPAEFIPIAEEMGLVVEIGAWALETACQEAAAWPEQTRVAVNLSPIQFRQKGLVEAVRQALDASGLRPDRLELEITESVLLQDNNAVLVTLRDLRGLGVRISLDDFGTGYSSLSYLRKFPLQSVKIDRSFIAGIEGDNRLQILVGGISRLCSELGLSVVVEGVETTAQLDVVMSYPGVKEAQGFLFARPAPGSRTRELLEAFRPSALQALTTSKPSPVRASEG